MIRGPRSVTRDGQKMSLKHLRVQVVRRGRSKMSLLKKMGGNTIKALDAGSLSTRFFCIVFKCSPVMVFEMSAQVEIKPVITSI